MKKDNGISTDSSDFVFQEIDLSVIIPCFLRDSSDSEYLSSCLASISQQLVKPSQIVISDNSKSDMLAKSVIQKFSDLKINYFHNTVATGIGANTNFAAQKASRKWIHILHQDDQLVSTNVYSFLQDETVQKMKWILLAGSEDPKSIVIPEVSRFLILGFNTIGGPSSLIVERNSYIPFAENLEMLIDVENFSNYYQLLGLPNIVKNREIQYGNPTSRASRNISTNKVLEELVWIINTHKLSKEFIEDSITDKKLNHFQQSLVLKAYEEVYEIEILKSLHLRMLLNLRRVSYCAK